MLGDENVLFDAEGIDPERIVNDEQQIANEFFCAICQGLLWKSKSCGSCQHLFCNKCIRTWLQLHPNSCPFRCSPYEEKRPPPYIHSLLGRLSIRCRNHSFGCNEILPYDLLEQHETVECQYLTKYCRICGQFILIEDIDEHQRICISKTIQCRICKNIIDRNLLLKHTSECLKERLNLLMEEMIPTLDEGNEPTNNLFVLQNEQENNNFLTRFNNHLQRFLYTVPQINLLGFDEVIQAREQNSWRKIWSILKLIWFNKSRTIQILFLLSCFGIGFLIGCMIAISLFIQDEVKKSLFRGFTFIIILSGLICFSLPILLASISDTLIMLLITFSLPLWSATLSKLPLDYFRIGQSSTLISIIFISMLVMFKIFLLMIRLYSWYIPPYLSAGCLAWTIIFITYHLRHFSI